MEVPTAWSQRARTLLNEFSPRPYPGPEGARRGYRQYADGKTIWWEGEDTVADLAVDGPWSLASRALWASVARLLKGRSWEKIKDISEREVEFFLRDRNSQEALPSEDLSEFRAALPEWQASVSDWRQSGVSLSPYTYRHELPLRELKLSDKIHELKAFFSSEKLAPFFRRGGKLEVVDVEDVTVYLALEMADIPQGAFLDWLQIMAVDTFQEPSLNLVPEEFPSGTPKKTV